MKYDWETEEQFLQRVKEARKKQKLTQVELAQLSNLGTRFISDLENGKPTCEIDKVLKVVANLGIKLEVNNV